MPNRFCAICGKALTKNSPHLGMCINCYSTENPLFELVNTFPVNICIDCGSYSKKDVWIDSLNDDLFSILEEIIKNLLLKPLTRYKQIILTFTIKKDDLVYSSRKLIKFVEVLVIGGLKNDPNIHHQQVVRLNLTHTLCRNCSNIHSGTYFTSILQLRVKNESQFDLIDTVLDQISKYNKSLFEKDRRQYISQIEDQKNGVDLYLGTKELLNHLIKFLKAKYHFILKKTKKLVGRDNQKGKNLFRTTALIKFLPISKNDLLLIDKKEYLVENITRSKVVLRSKDSIKLIKEYSYFFNESTITKINSV